MPRHQYKKRPVKADAIYNSHEVAKLINYIIIDGKKSVAQQIIYSTLEELKKDNNDPLKVLHKAITNVAPTVEVKPRRLGGASYLVPTEVRRERRLYLALNWILEAAKAKPNKEFKSFEAKLTSEILEASKNQGASVNKRLQA